MSGLLVKSMFHFLQPLFSWVLCAYSMDVDLTEQLKEAEEKYERRVQEAAEAAAAATARREADMTPSSGEVRRWQRSGRYSRKVSKGSKTLGLAR